MSFKLGDTLDKYGITYIKLARMCGRCKQTVYNDAYRRGVKSKFNAMAYAYALTCDVKDVLEDKQPYEDEGWEQPCLPGCEL